MSIADRLRAERERLGLNQAQFAAVGGASKRSQASWEAGDATPNAAFLAEVAKIGVDVQFVVTGRPAVEQLTEDEATLVQLLRSAPPAVRAATVAGLVAGSSAGGRVVIHGDVGQAIEGSITQTGVTFNVGGGGEERRRKK